MTTSCRRNTTVLIKYTLFSMNFTYWVLGVAMVAMGLYVYVDNMQPVRHVFHVILDPAIAMMLVGTAVFFTATSGCVGALRENACLLKTYVITLVLLVLILLSIGSLVVLVMYTDINLNISPEPLLRHALVMYREDSELEHLVNYVQSSLHCCGVGPAGYRDWSINPYFNCSWANKSPERCAVPFSCCKFTMGELVNLMCGYDITNTSSKAQEDVEEKIYTEGCFLKIEELLKNNAILLGIPAFTIVVPLVCGIVLATRLLARIQTLTKDEEMYEGILR
ncbi:tetraspanin-33-like [Limulus polyphemus]|uniref:Tetraspanin n=1 Tax=Limulus polyphemus TaxID=6850 RepID=A0ABM1TD19_LIMPO|nr:tetraspanin-33-like [Limulus polyphemus]XP_022253772.1 tetraspanin-33-like [Limulus polyphemus]XP_022253773.1 tetraspanin-33-like [Limulus polyphemus]XP_022253774.1 tetraspanin-33-like [Limulus polyphemus]XP_022253775.1 tetraspanin-33-like [Limulus polyphemus]